ncbi:hypothetical protein Ahy_B02g058970 [Arachis hypogaea]|uniref:Aminotransferase-like plant mobile domain-containing protein n=1 Tax=Arachis hypogaea TaxID=3818 RepID=A0A445AFS6_ARAHY|nr:hypothetical protein Ahy_B02g058970 [Arachis hypogaea]
MIDECVANFGIPSEKNDHVSSVIKLSWIRQILDAEELDTIESMQRYVRCHIFFLIGTTLFPDKLTSMVSCKYLPMLRNFSEIRSYSGDRHVWYIYINPCVGSRIMKRRRWMIN